MFTLTEARSGHEGAIAALCADLDEFYSSLPEGLPAECRLAGQMRWQGRVSGRYGR